MGSRDEAGEKMVKSSSENMQDRFHWYLSNAEVQGNFGRLPIWQKSKVFIVPSSDFHIQYYEFVVNNFASSDLFLFNELCRS